MKGNRACRALQRLRRAVQLTLPNDAFGSVTKTFAWGLAPAKQNTVVMVQVAATDVEWRPLGIRIVKSATVPIRP